MEPLLTPELLDALRTPAGAELLLRAEALAEDPFAAARLRDRAEPALAAAAVEQVRLRERARAKFRRAREMWFTRPLLEQASGETASRHRAARYEGWECAADLCSGLGGDALCLAEQMRVQALDRNPLAVALIQANAEVWSLGERVDTVLGEVPSTTVDAQVAWIDPGRREGGRRTRSLHAMSPSIDEVLGLLPRYRGMGVKLSPATPDRELDAALAGIPHERELLSVQGECRELVLWLGELRELGARRATLLPGGHVIGGEPVSYGGTVPVGEYLLEPDPAVIRAGLVGNLAEQLGAAPVDPELAYLTLDRDPRTPFAAAYRVERPEPFSGKRLAERLRAVGAGDVTLKTRGAAAQPELLRQQLRGVLKQGKPGHCPVVFITRLAGRPVMIVGERIGSGVEQQS